MMMRRHAEGGGRAATAVSEEQRALLKRIREQYEELFKIKEENGIEIHPIFDTLPIKKDYPDYYAVIKNPVSFNTLKKRVPHYIDAQNFMNDLAQIPWNAKTYNTKGSQIYGYASILEKFIKENILVKLKEYYPHLKYPNLGLLPDELEAQQKLAPEKNIVNTPTKMIQTVIKKNDSSMSISDEDDENYDDHDDRDDDYNDGRKSRTAKITFQRTTLHSRSPASQRHSQSTTPQPGKPRKTHVKRGRPPVIDLPYVQRMKNVIKMLRRETDESKRQLTATFEKIPDEHEETKYLSIISNPMPLEEIFKKVKTRKYKDFQGFQNDMNLMVANYKLYYRSNPQALKRANLLERRFAEYSRQELSKPDTDYMPEGELRYPLDDIVVNGTKYVIGDWALINNPNDPTKPTVGQIFKLWSTSDGKKWFNACWYIRPEQTVHRVDRLFYKNEVFKTGQYRDHLTSELVGKGYVVHFTRYQRGDPDIKIDGPLFVCEFRYNENDKGFNKIRTWKACLPEEIRDQEEVTIPINGRKFFKYASPIKHLLPANATATDPIPQPKEGAPNAPPIAGGVYIRPKLKRDDLGEYSTSDDCPRYIIRPGDPPEDGKIDFEMGTITTSSLSMTGLPRSSGGSGTRLSTMRQSRSSTGLPMMAVPGGQSFYPQNNSTTMDGMKATPQAVGMGSNITVHGLKQHQLYKIQQQHQQQQQHKKSQASGYNLTTIVNNLTSKASKATLGQIVIDTSGAYVLPVSITKNVDVLQRSDYGSIVKRLGKDEAKKRKRKGEILWFKGPSVAIEERMLNSGDEHLQLPLNSCFATNKKLKIEYEEIEEPLDSSDQTASSNSIQEDVQLQHVNDSQSKKENLPGSFPLGLRPSANFMAFKLSSSEPSST
ncbi:hypothetical protein Kpol_1042p15 [Vanderwaltozyma polyspora DSM 70294]|uniref:Uncharacterized protein n=1 Tax=Vanderwaltozyma polyspora (strain ATCC 22028 / DSM 70294 / BCRC 21397 / CBS 2163 / NBRC 10782 / NRRL Y-8283 / UCD 57-17) TaxID=436907 RepID=A7TQA2_VANPO|nr:uncharacterized protein Kpol_1042p15 [Vanderwaltozyma polyspora DSM 70294]EDO15556.1 hypothetical protein Kpol_1042p15 [Vanderwaltozyma polyspora DSM 70294]